MNPNFADYYWKNGRPKGITPLPLPQEHETSYKIIVDPYFKRFSIEKYVFGNFIDIVYDSIFLDFRKLSPQEQLAWQRETINEENGKMTCLIRNIEDRIILIEELEFQNSLCKVCRVFSPHRVHLSTHRMYYKVLSDSFNGVILLDSQEKLCMYKKYEANEQGEFEELLEENWNMNEENTIKIRKEVNGYDKVCL